jgi:hypothetical protein
LHNGLLFVAPFDTISTGFVYSACSAALLALPGYGRICNRNGRKAYTVGTLSAFDLCCRLDDEARLCQHARTQMHTPAQTHARTHSSSSSSSSSAHAHAHTSPTHPPTHLMHIRAHSPHAPATHALAHTHTKCATHSHCSGVHSAQVNKVDKLVFGKDPFTDDARGRARNEPTAFTAAPMLDSTLNPISPNPL